MRNIAAAILVGVGFLIRPMLRVPHRSPAPVAVLGLIGLLLPLSAPTHADLLVGNSDGSILRYDAATGAFGGVFIPAGRGGLTGQPGALTYGPDGNLYVSDSFGTNSVLRFNGTTGAFIDTFASTGGLFRPLGLVFGPDGNLYVADFGNFRVLRYSGATGALIDTFIAATGGGAPAGLAFGPDGNLFISTTDSSAAGLVANVRQYDGTTGTFLNAGVADSQLLDIAFGPDGNIYVPGLQSSSVLLYSGTTLAFLGAFVPTGAGGLSAPEGLLFGPNGDLYVSSRSDAPGANGSVLRYDGTTGAFLGAFVAEGTGGLTSAARGFIFAPGPLSSVPEPSTVQLLALALLLLPVAVFRRRRSITSRRLSGLNLVCS